MKVHELLEILAEHNPDHDVVLVTDRYTGPFMTDLRGVVQTSGYGPLMLCADYNARRIDSDPWSELDGPMEMK